MIDVTEGLTSIEVAANKFPDFNLNGYLTTARGLWAKRSESTGARVTVAFSRREPLPPDTDIRVLYDIAQNGGVRQLCGTPQLTHTTARESVAYHYRLSQWIPAPAVMRFVLA